MTLAQWRPLVFEPAPRLTGRHCALERLDPNRHSAALHDANRVDDSMWDYLPYGLFATQADHRAWAEGAATGTDPVFYAIGRGAEAAVWSGIASYLRLDRANGVIEIGHLAFSPALQRTAAATEAIHLLLAQAFDAGFRRVEWKCNAANAASRRAAERYGFAYEGTFRQHMVVKGKNRDTACFAMLDRDWPEVKRAHAAWLDPANFDRSGRQRRPLARMSDGAI